MERDNAFGAALQVRVPSLRPLAGLALLVGTGLAFLALRGPVGRGLPVHGYLAPNGAVLEAQLFVPARLAFLVEPGQPVLIRYDALPYQRFGHHAGQVVLVGEAVLHRPASDRPVATGEPLCRIVVRLASQQLVVRAEVLPLQAGMLIDADLKGATDLRGPGVVGCDSAARGADLANAGRFVFGQTDHGR